MTLPIERARSRRPITWLTIIGVLLLPAVVGGILVGALANPTERLDAMTAAVVNLDEPVTIDGQYTPLGRQLAAGLVEGSDEMDSNLSWVISNEDDAAEGLADGRYQATVTIPEGFSAAATSTGQVLGGGDAVVQQAEISVVTPPDSRVADDLITGQLASVAASTMGTMLSEATFENVLIGFSTLGEQLGEAADGAATWADGARSAADGAVTLADGIRELSGGAAELAAGARGIADGTDGIASGSRALAQGARDAATGLGSWSAGARELSAGTADLAGGLTTMADQVAQLPEVPQEIIDAANGLAANSEQIQASVSDAATRLAAAAESCAADGGSAELCAALADISTRTNAALPQINDAIGQSGQVAEMVNGLAQFGPQLTAGLRQSAAGAQSLAGGMNGLAAGADDAAAGIRDLAGGMSDLSTGAGTLADGTRTWAGGAGTLAEGAATAADGTDELAGGVGELADGADTLSSGLGQAADALPAFDEKESANLASVIADPVTSTSDSDGMFGPTTIPLLATVALWFGAFASFIALRAVPGNALTSRRSSAAMVLRGFWPAAAIGAGQGILVSLIVQIVAGYDAATWWAFAGFAVLAGIAFAAVNQALLAVVGGIGRWVSALVGVVALATGLISTIPGWLAGLGAAMPTAPALAGLVVPSGAAAAGLIVWGVLSLGAATVAVATRRTTSAKAALAAA